MTTFQRRIRGGAEPDHHGRARAAVVAWLREPLVHFLVLGALLFFLSRWAGGSGPDSNRIVITQGHLGQLSAGFALTWRRPPTNAELKALIDDYVQEEIAIREARALGLERDDTVVRRRLRQKLEFLVEDAAEAAPPTDAELQAWLESHVEAYREEPRFSFRQIFFDLGRVGRATEADARALLERLSHAGTDVDSGPPGDPSMLPRELSLAPSSIIGRTFGQHFAATLAELEPGRWAGPVTSGYGLHLVYVRERLPGRSPALDAVRDAVIRDLLSDRRKKQLEAMYERLLERYSVTIERPAAGATRLSSVESAAAPVPGRDP